MQICHKSFFYEIQIKIPSEIKPGENYMRVIRLVEGCHQLSWLSDSIRAQNERGISDIRAVRRSENPGWGRVTLFENESTTGINYPELFSLFLIHL